MAMVRLFAVLGMLASIAVSLALLPVPLNLIVAWLFWHYCWEMIEQLS